MGYSLSRSDGRAWNGHEYEYLSASVTVAGTAGTGDLSDETGFTTLFSFVPKAHHITIEASATTYIRLNEATNDKITITSTTPFTSDYLLVEKIFISTGAGASTVTVKLA